MKKVIIAAIFVIAIAATAIFVRIGAASESAPEEALAETPLTQNREALTPEEKEKLAENFERFREGVKEHIYEQGIPEQIEYIEAS